MKKTLTKSILTWYLANRRDLPWRKTKDPYSILVSELMLQQTQVATVIPYYERFLKKFPNAKKLSGQSEAGVLKAWEGLGYYRRARFLHAASKKIHEGGFPETLEKILELPGVGEYTAAAVGSIALGIPAAVIDGNVIRVLTRIFALEGDPMRLPLKIHLKEIANQVLDKKSPGDFNQAMMELGALICSPTAPDCSRCPASGHCKAYQAGEPTLYPQLAQRTKSEKVLKLALVMTKGKGESKKILMQMRDVKGAKREEGRLGGFWQFPEMEIAHSKGVLGKAEKFLKSLFGEKAVIEKSLDPVTHQITHYRITVLAFSAREGEAFPPWRWVNSKDLEKLPLAKAEKLILKGI